MNTFEYEVAGIDGDYANLNNDIMGDKYRRPDRYGILSDEKARGVIGGGFVIGKE